MKTPPYEHQTVALKKAESFEGFGLFMEQGTGKTRTALDRAVQLHAIGEIDICVIIAPNGVHRDWIQIEIPKHVDVPCIPILWSSSMGKRATAAMMEALAKPGLKFIALNVEAFSLSNAYEFVCLLIRKQRALVIVDESSLVSHISAKRTKRIIKIGALAKYRLALSGTPVTEGPLDLYAQFQFIEPGSLGFSNYTAFKAHYGVWRKRVLKAGIGPERSFDELVGYRNLDELKRLVDARSFTITKAECLDLPEKVYVRRPIELSKEHRRIYDEVKRKIIAEIMGSTLTTNNALKKLLRLAQVAGGFVQLDDDASVTRLPTNPKLDALMELVDSLPRDAKVIIWARFIPELRLIADILPGKVARYWGEIPKEQRAESKEAFQNGDTRWFVSNPRSGGYGLTLTAASHVIYFSRDYSLAARLQSEDRAHRIGQTKTVTYTDLFALDTLDGAIADAVSAKQDLASIFKSNGDIAKWLEER